ncbi:hypothetical protein ABC895_12865 [Capnocytophaga sputigena]|uniref:hypothetical protein n=1 Tax=Capnocytophaga sputigena TaxID=1019 RepID=UPI0031F4A466
MDKFEKVVAILICLFYISCANNYYYTKSYGLRPKVSNFKLAKPTIYQLKKDDLIDTNSIYVYSNTNLFDKTKNVKMILRFFSNGRFSFVFGKEDYNNLEENYIGYYKVNNNNQVLMETFIKTSPSAGGQGIYSRSLGLIKNDTLYKILDAIDFTDVRWEGKKISQKYHTYYPFIKQKVDTLTGTPDW